MPGGDSVSKPDWDGLTTTAIGNAWVPLGNACWEVSCQAKFLRKAEKDFGSRVLTTSVDDMQTKAFVVVSSRRWSGKNEWAELAALTAPWKAVTVLDADDLEAWLEQATGVRLWFGEILGLTGPGAESIDRHWLRWRSQSRLALTPDCIRASRDEASTAFSQAIAKAMPTIYVQADSHEEAVAFVCVQLIERGAAAQAACITLESGWQFVDANAALQFVVACTPELATGYAPRPGLTLIVPISTGDGSQNQSRSAGRLTDPTIDHITLRRPSAYDFEQHLRQIGEEEADAARLARTCGRSWSVYRRVCASNPAVRRPAWLKPLPFRSLELLTLVGAWDESSAGDRACIEAVSGRRYDEIEAELLRLAALDDAPVLRLGHVWKAKAAMELLHLVAPLIASTEFVRFFDVAQAVLAKPDPALELEDEKRWMAAVFGRVRAESNLFIAALGDSLPKLSVYAERQCTATGDLISHGVRRLVRNLLDDANAERWLSLANVLRELAEAAPEDFLSAVEASLRLPGAPVRQLLTETGPSGGMGRCWHAGLLWALEVLAWSPANMPRTAAILAQLSNIRINGNWGNSPSGTLQSLFRAWWPQTSANSAQRLATIDLLCRDHPGCAWSLLRGAIPSRLFSASSNATPHWRDDDSGMASGINSIDLSYVAALMDRLVAMARGNAARIADLIADLDKFDDPRRSTIVACVEACCSMDDDERVLVRDAVRQYLGRHNSFNVDGQGHSCDGATRLQLAYNRLDPKDAVKRNLWLFAQDWACPLGGHGDDFEITAAKVEVLRQASIGAVMASASGWAGITALAHACQSPRRLGLTLASADLPPAELHAWALSWFGSRQQPADDPLLQALFAALPPEWLQFFVTNAPSALETDGVSVTHAAAWFSNAPLNPQALAVLADAPKALQDKFWATTQSATTQLGKDERAQVIDRLLAAGRPRTAFQSVQFVINDIAPLQVFSIMKGIRDGAEANGPLPEQHRIGDAFAHLHVNGKLMRSELANLEFHFFEALVDTKYRAQNLLAEIFDNLLLFIKFICLVYRRASAEVSPLDESMWATARPAGRVLQDLRGLPGSNANGTLDQDAFELWVQNVRKLGREHDRAANTDLTIGQWFSASGRANPVGLPPVAVLDLLQRDDAEDIRRGFEVGVLNGRTLTLRRSTEASNQDRMIAEQHRGHAESIRSTHPKVAAMFLSMADAQEADARRTDIRAMLREEGL